MQEALPCGWQFIHIPSLSMKETLLRHARPYDVLLLTASGVALILAAKTHPLRLLLISLRSPAAVLDFRRRLPAFCGAVKLTSARLFCSGFPLVLVAAFILCVEPSKSQTWKWLFAQADTLQMRKQNDSALTIGRSALQIVRNELTKPDTLLAYACQKLGFYCILSGKFEEGRLVYEEALRIREQLQGIDHLDIIHILLRLGICYLNVDELGKAEAALVRHIEIVEKWEGTTSLLLEKPMNNLALIWAGRGRFADAEKLEMQLLKLRQTAYGATHPALASSYVNMGSHLLAHGKLVAAEENLRRVQPLLEKAGLTRDSRIPMALNGLGEICFEHGRIEEAEQLFLRALALNEEINGVISTLNVGTLNNLGKLNVERREFSKAEAYYRRAYLITEQMLGPTHSSSISSLMRMSEFYSLIGEHIKGDSLLLLAKAIIVRTYGTQIHPRFALAQRYLAESRFRQNDYAVAESLSLAAVQIHEATLGRKGPYFIESLELYAQSLRHQGKARASLAAFREVFDTRAQLGRLNYSIMSEKDALTSSRSLRRSADHNLSVIFDLLSTAPYLSISGAAIVLRGKGQVDEVTFERRSLARSEQDSNITELMDDWRRMKARTSNLYVKGVGERPPNTVGAKLDSLISRVNELESELARRSSAFRILKDNYDVGSARIQSLLPTGSCLIEYLRFKYRSVYNDSISERYLVLLLDKNSSPVLQDLGDAKQIEKLVEQSKRLLAPLPNANNPSTGVAHREYRKISSALRDAIWKPIAKHIKPGQPLFIAPDGALNLISFATLMDEKGKYLIEKHPIHYLTAGRDLIRISQDSTQSGEGLLALGDPDYNATVARRLSNEQMLALNAMPADVGAARNVRSGCEALSEMNVQRLPNTGAEVNAIAKYFPSSNVFEGRAATEENFKRNAIGQKAIHIATHGYFISGECQAKLTQKSDTYVGENPLLQSGLFLAGANLKGSDIKSDEAEDGILTALEVSAMDLRGTDLVVLSACETGLGKVEQGEGVYGLRRAFQMAGAKTVVSSLWKVPDKETMQFMKTLYSTKAKTYPELMQQVALKRIRELRLRGRPTHPFTWGAFVATGDWRIH